MRKKSQGGFTQVSVNKGSDWDVAISEAERQLREAEERVKRLRLIVQSFVDRRAKGQPFLGEVQREAKPL